jgi:hypothetical protein
MTEELVGKGLDEVLSKEESMRRLKEYSDWCQTEEGRKYLSDNPGMKYISKIYEGPDGEAYIDLPDELIEATGWTELTDLIWNWNAKTNEVSIMKKENDDEL